ncbi:MAG: hypothetical protein QGG71_20640, partial [Pirellulaceae bacterium]|nr:hypothetical protein [Pirellulaceae bacterium]
HLETVALIAAHFPGFHRFNTVPGIAAVLLSSKAICIRIMRGVTRWRPHRRNLRIDLPFRRMGRPFSRARMAELFGSFPQGKTSSGLATKAGADSR